MKIQTAALLLLLLAGCHVAATAEDYHWTLKAPATVVDDTHLRFSVETSAPDGRRIASVPYVWVVDWVHVHGVQHQGRSFREESLRVKGAPGIACLHVLAVDRADRLIEVARATFEVTADGGAPRSSAIPAP